jgi:hypothetical protein
MRSRRAPSCAFCLTLAFLFTPADLFAESTYDLVVYGPTTAGVAAAVQAKRMGKSVIIVGPDQHLGGLTSGGLGWTDSGNKSVVGGISREFYQRIKTVYDRPETWKWQKPGDFKRYRPKDDAHWTFAPHIAEQVFEDLVKEHGIQVDRDEWLDRAPGKGVAIRDGVIRSIRMLSGKTYRGRMFIDAAYEGDLMAAAGVSYFVGREANSQYGETLNGIQIDHARSHQFTNPIDPYVVPGDPKSGLLPRISADPPGRQGEADKRLQAYCYRVCLTRVPENRIPFAKPDGYDVKQYELLLRTLQAGSWHIRGKFDMLPNLKTDTNNHGSFSTDNIGMNYDYPEASYERRQEILKEHEIYQKGYFYFLANDPRVPEDRRKWMAEWGLAKDEFVGNNNWPHQIYVREARRMVSDFVVSEQHVVGHKPTPRPIGMGSYNMDSHNTQRYVDPNGHVRNEGDVQVSPGGPYPIDYGAIVPKRNECQNLLVPVCLSCSHIAFGSIRMEPVFMVLGQSAATAACQAIDADKAVQDIDYAILRKRLLEDKQVLEYTGARRGGVRLDRLKGVVVDDAKAIGSKAWAISGSQPSFVGRGYRHDGNTRKGEMSAVYSASLPQSGKYEVLISYSPNPNRATNVPVSVEHAQGRTQVVVNQKKKPAVDGLFHSLGAFEFRAGAKASVTISNNETDGHVIIDAVQWIAKP